MAFTTPFLGSVVLKKIAGVDAAVFTNCMAVGAELIIPAVMVSPVNPLNVMYPGVINATAYPSVFLRGKRGCAFSISTFAKPNWFLYTLFNSLVLTAAAGNNTSDEFALAIDDASSINYGGIAADGVRYFTKCRCSSVSLMQNAVGGPISVEMTFLCAYGDDTEDRTADPTVEPTFSSLNTITPGEMFDVSDVSFNSTINECRSWRLTLNRGQGFVYYADATLYPSDIMSAMFSGSLQLECSPTATAIPSASATIDINNGAGGRVKFALALKADDRRQNQTIEMGNRAHFYTLGDFSTGLVPAVITNS